MPTTLTQNINSTLTWALTQSNALNSPSDRGNIRYSKNLTSGTADGQINQQYVTRVVLAASATTNIDLAGALTNSFGETITLTAVKSIMAINRGIDSGNGTTFTENAGDNVDIGGAGAGTAVASIFAGDVDAKISVEAGGIFMAIAPQAGWAVTATSADIIRIENTSSNALTVDLVVGGVA